VASAIPRRRRSQLRWSRKPTWIGALFSINDDANDVGHDRNSVQALESA
jgi:hypothetical protein